MFHLKTEFQWGKDKSLRVHRILITLNVILTLTKVLLNIGLNNMKAQLPSNYVNSKPSDIHPCLLINGVNRNL